MTQQSIVQRAADEFRQGNYLRALDLYRRLAELLGEKHFRANILLCERRLRGHDHQDEAALPLRAIKVASVMDEFTFQCYAPECNLWALSPDSAIDELETFKPDLLFIESAWRGKNDLWSRKIGSLSQELKAVLRWCKDHGVPTIFWNKEDPVHFETFLTTAREFDFVFTTDIDCIARYKAALGHEHVYLLPFACQPKVHNPIEQYQRKDAFCFAGAYYVRYPERTRDLENYIQQLPDYKPLEIFDRNYGKEDANYKFPEEYQKFIVGTLPFNEIDKAYKGYRYSINMNSIKQSQTMFARRIYELLGSNTLTVSNFSRGVRLLFGDLVVASDNGAEIVGRLCSMSEEVEQKHRLAALRKVMLEHTYQHRLAYVVGKALGRSVEDTLPTMVGVVSVETEQQYKSAVENYRIQRHANKKLILVLNGGFVPGQEFSSEDLCGITVVAEVDAAELTLHGLADQKDWLVVMVAEDYYGPNYLLDLALATRYTDVPLIGKALRYKFNDGQASYVDAAQPAYRVLDGLPRRASAIQVGSLPGGLKLSSCLDDAVDGKWQLPGLAIDPFNYCEGGRLAAAVKSCSGLVDDLSLDVGLSIHKLMRDAEGIAPMAQGEISASIWSASEIRKIFGEIKHEKISFEIRAGGLFIKSMLEDARHEYIYAKTDIPVSTLPKTDVMENHLEATPGLEIQYVYVFYGEKKERLGHAILTANRNQTAEIPVGSAFVRMGWRIRGSGETQIKGLQWGHRKFELARLFGRSDTLLLTNHYPSYDNLYRNGFVHSRVKSYLDRAVLVDVFRLHPVESVSYHEFKNVDVMTGNTGALRTLINGGGYKHVLVHFLTPEMWDVLKHYPELKITVWIHGSEIQPWHRRDYNYQNEQERAKAKAESQVRMQFWRELLQPIAPNLKLVFVSRHFAEEVFEDLGFRVADDRYKIIHNPIDTELFSYRQKPVEQRKKILSIRPYASRTYANDLSVNAILKLAEQPFFSELEFRMIGDGKLFDETLEPLRRFPNVRIERRFLTHPEIAAIHKDYGICLIPTRMDTQGVSRDEAMASGLVPVTNAVAAIPEFVDASCGVLARAENADDLAAGIVEIYETPSRFAELSKAASDRVRRQSGADAVVWKELSLFSGKKQ